jgi:AcrR family transcriptional regulator
MVVADHRHGDEARRDAVLEAAMATFARFGYRKTSMQDVAREARISRPGLYFLFATKAGLFRSAAERAVTLDLAAAEGALAELEQPLGERVVAAFDSWAGRYVGAPHDVAAVLDDNPDLVGPVVQQAPLRFEAILEATLRQGGSAKPTALARTLTSVSIGLKHQMPTREDYRTHMTEAVQLLIPAP